MKTILWDKHSDEFYRISNQLASIGFHVERYVGDVPPHTDSADRFILHEGPWIDHVPAQMRPKCILALCKPVISTEITDLKLRGYTRALTKTARAASQWPPGDAVCLPPMVRTGYPCSDASEGILSLINLYQKRDPDSFAVAKSFPDIRIFGFECPNGPVYDESQVLSRAKYLLHIKHCGFLCNAVIKALAHGVPVIMDTKTWQDFGYEDVLTHNFNAFIHPKPRDCLPTLIQIQPNLSFTTSQDRDRWSKPDPVAAKKAADLISG